MRFGKLTVAVAIATVLSSQGLSALGLGEIKLNSTLNQPLDAEISLLQTRDLTVNEILAGLASMDDFKSANIERNYFLSGLTFKVDMNAPGGPVVRVTSEKQVQEPYLNFLVETRWPSGRLLREYTLLMDLPVFTDGPVEPVRAARTSNPSPKPQASRSQPSTKPAVVREREAPKPRQTVSRSEPSSTSSYGPVGSNETLWAIAKKVRPAPGISVQQTMLAIQRLNPNAFIDGNINLLRRGQVLRIPTEAEVNALSVREAVREVAQQNTAWSGNANGDITGAPLDASSQYEDSQPKASSRSGRIKLANGDGQSSGLDGDGEVGQEAGTARLNQAMEQLDKSNRHNSELRSKVEDLESQIETMERLVEVSSSQLRALQLAAAKPDDSSTNADNLNEASDLTPADDLPSSLEGADDVATLEGADDVATLEGADGESGDSEAAQSSTTAEQDNNTVKKPAPKVSSVVTSKPAEPSFIDMFFDNIIYIGVGVLALLGGAWAWGRRKQDDEDEEEFEGLDAASLPQQLENVEEDIDLDDADALNAIDPESSEAVSEADIYIAYGKFDEAENLLNEHLSTNPENHEARLKLMEVFCETRDYASVDEQLAIVKSSAPADVVDRASSLRESMGDPVAASDALDALGLDLDGDSDSSGDDGDFSTGELDLSGMDFDLDSADDDAGLSLIDNEAALPEVDASGELSDLEFDMALSMDGEVQSDAVADLSGVELEIEAPMAGAGIDDDSLDFDVVEFESGLDSLTAELSEEPIVESLGLEVTDDLAVEAVEVADTANDFDVSSGLDELTAELESESSATTDLVGEVDLDDMDAGFDSALDELSVSLEDAPQLDANVAEVADDSASLDISSETALAGAAVAAATAALVSDVAKNSSQEVVEDFDAGDFDLGTELGEDDLNLDLDAEGDFDLAALDKELDSDLSLDAEFDSEVSMPELTSSADDGSGFGFIEGAGGPVEPTVAVDKSDLDALDVSLGDVSMDLQSENETSNDIDNELEFLADTDEVATKLDLARAYMDMGDKEGAKEILEEVAAEGDEQQRKEADELIERI